MTQESAETLALQALGWLAGQAQHFDAFCAATGATPAGIPVSATDPAFLASVLDFLLTDDALIVAFCDAAGLGYTTPMQARAALPGGIAVNWT